ncbi:hypothetical protein L1887_09969 [Cichorium endivia]|nr:hypothetical protein L1887_09969 [Cichorium endivia]
MISLQYSSRPIRLLRLPTLRVGLPTSAASSVNKSEQPPTLAVDRSKPPQPLDITANQSLARGCAHQKHITLSFSISEQTKKQLYLSLSPFCISLTSTFSL